MHVISLYVEGNDDYGRMVRRSLMRYLILTLILVLRSISSPVKKRFPTLEHVVESGDYYLYYKILYTILYNCVFRLHDHR